MNIALLQIIDHLEPEIRDMIKDVGNSCYDWIKQRIKENRNKPIENPIENFIQYGGETEKLKVLENECWSITKQWLIESAVAAGAVITNQYYGTGEAAEQAGATYETAKKWAAKNGVKKSTIGKKSVYQWTDDDIDNFIER